MDVPLFDQMWCDAHTNRSQVLNSDHGLQYVLKGLNPPYMSDMFKSVLEVSCLLTRSRQSNKQYIHQKDICISKRSLKYSGAVLYNTIQEGQSVASFKYEAFKHFM